MFLMADISDFHNNLVIFVLFCFFMSAWPVNSDFVPSFIVSFIFPM